MYGGAVQKHSCKKDSWHEKPSLETTGTKKKKKNQSCSKIDR